MLRFVKRCQPDTKIEEGLPGWFATLLAMRGVDTKEKAELFLHPSLSQLVDPYLMQGMDKAVALLKRAINDQTPCVVYGDYDVDGVSSTSMMLLALRSLGAVVEYYIPSRHEEGYGLNEHAVKSLAQSHRLLITVDCGITAAQEVALAKELGMTVIVTDHHQLGPELPPADAVLNPLMGDYPFRRLCGAGVAFKLLQALGGLELAQEYLDLAALATIADLVPLHGENRVIAALGLAKMGQTNRLGLAALMEAAGIDVKGKKGVNAGQVAFGLAPRVNAGGRLKSASLGVELMLTKDADRARELAQTLNNENTRRQQLEAEIFAKALAQVELETDFLTDRILMADGEDFNHGVIGLAASRLTERYHYPSIVFAKTGEECVGSARSIPGVNIHEMLSTCLDLFIRFGGHEQAAGLTIKAQHLPELRRRLNEAIHQRCDPQVYIPVKEYDVEVSLGDVTEDMAKTLAKMQPSGFGNPEPVFMVAGAQVQDMRPVGKEGVHLKCSLYHQDALRSAIAFQMGRRAAHMPQRVDVLFAPELNEWNNHVTVQCNIKAIRPSGAAGLADDMQRAQETVLQEMWGMTANTHKIHPHLGQAGSDELQTALTGAQGTVILCRAPNTARRIAMAYGEKLHVTDRVEDRRGFHTLLYPARIAELSDMWHTLILADGELMPGEAAALQEKCPRARILSYPQSQELKELVKPLALLDDELRRLYKTLGTLSSITTFSLSAAAHLSVPQVKAGLYVLSQLSLIAWEEEPFTLTKLPPVKCSLDDSLFLKTLRSFMN